MKDGDRVVGGVVISRNDVEKHKQRILDQILLINPAEAATVLACSPRTVHNLIQANELTGYNNSGPGTKGVRLLAAELRDYVNSMKIDQDEWRK